MKREFSSFVDAMGVRLHARIASCTDSSAPPVVILHGFTGSTESMRDVATELSSTRDCVSVDLIGHGRSDAPRAIEAYAMDRCVAQLACVIDSLGLERPHLVGYSMGGRAALAFCSSHPERARSALLIGASAGLIDPEARKARIRADETLANEILTKGLDSFVDAWMAKPIFASQHRLGAETLARHRAQRMRNRPHALASSLRAMGTGAMTPLELAGLKVPTCFIAGDEDEKFCSIARAFGDRLPGAHFERIPNSGHAAHLENPEQFGRVARAFFARVDAETDQPPEVSPGCDTEGSEKR